MTKLFFHFSVDGFSNTYLLGPNDGGEAAIIDPGTFDCNMLELIEDNKMNIKHVFITHDHDSHIKGLKTLLKVYDATIYSASKEIKGFPCAQLVHNQKVQAGNYEITAWEVPGHSSDSLVFKCDQMLFTGDVLAAGHIGDTDNEYSRERLLNEIKRKILNIEDNLFIFPGHGPPTTLDTEKKFNITFGSESAQLAKN